jgi:hypothetical protein
LEEGGWISDNAWLGSIMTDGQTEIHFKVKSTRTVKGNTALYPMEALHAILQAQSGTKKVGHQVVLKTSIAGIDLIAVAYAIIRAAHYNF